MGGGCSSMKATPKHDGPEEDFGTEVDAGRADGYRDNEIREVKITDNFSILVSRLNEEFFAYGSKCPHYGALLKNGVYMDGVIRCPWHGASFDVRTGDIEEYPGLDCIPTYHVVVEKAGHVKVYHKPEQIGVYKIQRPIFTMQNDGIIYIILGAGASALTAAQTLREHDFVGRIIMITKDSFLPYDRTKLSKNFSVQWNDIKLRDEDWFKECQIEVMLNCTLEWVDVENQEVLVDGMSDPLRYSKLLVATGMKARLPETKTVPGIELRNIHTIFDIRDVQRLKTRIKSKEICIVGSGFIGMELIGPMLSAGASKITVLHRSRRPYANVFGDTVGRLLQQFLLQKFKKKLFFVSGDDVKAINGKGQVESISTLKKRTIKCDLVIYAIGGVPSTDFLLPYRPSTYVDSGFHLSNDPCLGKDKNGFIPVNEFMETHLANHYACGDIVKFPTRMAASGTANMGHWSIAQRSGRVAGHRMMNGKDETIYNALPFFWTNVGGVTLRYVGYGEDFNHTVIYGDLKALKFCILYKRSWKILACLTCNCDPIAARVGFDIQDNIKYPKELHPTYITDIFKAPPIVGDTTYGVRFYTDERLFEFDLINRPPQQVPIPRRMKDFRSMKVLDVNYVDHPLMTAYEKRLYNNQQISGIPVHQLSGKKKYENIQLSIAKLQNFRDQRALFVQEIVFPQSEKQNFW